LSTFSDDIFSFFLTKKKLFSQQLQAAELHCWDTEFVASNVLSLHHSFSSAWELQLFLTKFSLFSNKKNSHQFQATALQCRDKEFVAAAGVALWRAVEVSSDSRDPGRPAGDAGVFIVTRGAYRSVPMVKHLCKWKKFIKNRRLARLKYTYTCIFNLY
jgi:hypothetical protein